MQIDIDQQCSQIIARRQPAAIDLRMILTVTKIVNDLERIGDEVKKIAYKAAPVARRRAACGACATTTSRAPRCARRTMLQLALDAFARLDVDAAAEVIATATRRSMPRSRRSCASSSAT